MSYSRKRFSFWRAILLSLLGLVIYLEVIVYFIAYLSWPSINGWLNDSNVTRVLFVSDPQLLGEEAESWISRWDCDRYLRNSFSMAVNYARPSCVVFLGDLMDEGSISSNDQWNRYYGRFKKIFKLEKLNQNCTIFIPGDNDIGGEHEIIRLEKVDKFGDHFSNDATINFRNLQFIKISKILNTIPSLQDFEENTTVRIAISHVPITGYEISFGEKVISEVKPHIIFSGHEHSSLHLVADGKSGLRTLIEELSWNELSLGHSSWRFQLSTGLLNEIVVPTCSYRMGKNEMAFGLAEIDSKEKALSYHLFWLPNRLTHLLVYMYSSITLGLLVIFTLLSKLMLRKCYGFWKVAGLFFRGR